MTDPMRAARDAAVASARRRQAERNGTTPGKVASDRPNGDFGDLRDSLDPPWGEPIPLGAAPSPAPFPLEVFPERLRRFVAEAAESLNCPPDYLAAPLLAVAGGMIGASRALSITETHQQRPSLYVAVVAPPGSAKSPALDLVTAPLAEEEERLHEEWERAVEDYDARPDTEKGRRPVARRVMVGDVTTEVMALILRDNPRGVTMVNDELVGWAAAMGQYKGGKGNDRQFWLSAWSGQSPPVDRKNTHEKGPVRVRRPFVSIVGGMTPDNLRSLRGDERGRRGADDGFLDRILFAYPERRPARGETWASVSKGAREALTQTLSSLSALKMEEDEHGKPRPFFLHLDASAREAWKGFTDRHAEEENAPGFPDHLKGPWSKLKGYCGRLALIVHYLHWAEHGQAGGPGAGVAGLDIARAEKLVSYFKSHARRAYGDIAPGRDLKGARKVWGWVVREAGQRKITSFKPWEPYKDLQSDSLFPEPSSLDGPLRLLEQHNLIRPLEAQERAGPGRKPATTYLINPLAASRGNPANPANGRE